MSANIVVFAVLVYGGLVVCVAKALRYYRAERERADKVVAANIAEHAGEVGSGPYTPGQVDPSTWDRPTDF